MAELFILRECKLSHPSLINKSNDLISYPAWVITHAALFCSFVGVQIALDLDHCAILCHSNQSVLELMNYKSTVASFLGHTVEYVLSCQWRLKLSLPIH